MDHLKTVMNSEQHNGVTSARLTGIFGCLLICSCDAAGESASQAGLYPSKTIVNTLDTDQAARTLGLLFEIWPSRVSKSEILLLFLFIIVVFVYL